MAYWQRTLNMVPEWDQAKDGDVAIPELAKLVSERLAALKPFGLPDIDDERDELVGEFADLAKNPEADAADFDGLYDRLCDWGDTSLDDCSVGGRKVCWIKTF